MKPLLIIIIILSSIPVLAQEQIYNQTTKYINTTLGNQSLIIPEINNSIINNTLENNSITNSTPTPPLVSKCNVSLSLDSNKDLYESGETIKIYNKISKKSFPFIIEYWVEDLFGNIVKKKILTTNSNSKRYTPKINERDKVLIIKNRIEFINCHNSVKNITNEKYIIIRNNDANIFPSNSSIEIVKVSKDPKFGDILKVTLKLYRGDTRKYSVKAWLQGYQKISDVSSIHLKSKFTSYYLTIPVQIKSNCNNRYGPGSYKLMVEGLNLSESIPISVSGKSKNCKTKIVEKEIPIETKERLPKFDFNIISSPVIHDEYNYSISLTNNDKYAHNISVETYLFRGNKKHSSIQSKSKKIPPKSSKQIHISALSNSSSGLYKIMAKIRVDNQSTIRRISQEVTLLQESKKSESTKSLQKSCTTITLNSTKTPDILTAKVVYESKSIRLRAYIPYFLVFALLLSNVLVLFDKLFKHSINQ